jgi:hypothetical protein
MAGTAWYTVGALDDGLWSVTCTTADIPTTEPVGTSVGVRSPPELAPLCNAHVRAYSALFVSEVCKVREREMLWWLAWWVPWQGASCRELECDDVCWRHLKGGEIGRHCHHAQQGLHALHRRRQACTTHHYLVTSVHGRHIRALDHALRGCGLLVSWRVKTRFFAVRKTTAFFSTRRPTPLYLHTTPHRLVDV